MTHLYIELNTGLTEEVNSSIISKLYELAISGDLDNTSDLKGRLHSSTARDTHVAYLNEEFDDLHITVDTLYMTFADPQVEQIILNQGWGDGIGVTSQDLGLITTFSGSVFGNSNITSFNEYKYFANATTQSGAFSGCSNLTSIEYPPASTTVGGEAHLNNTSLTNVKIDNTQITSIGIRAFKGCSSLLSITLPLTCTSIGLYAFNNCTSLTTIDLSNVTSLGLQCFRNSGITSVNISNVSTLDSDSFMECASLLSVIGLSNATSLNNNMFNGCQSLSTIDVDFSKITKLGPSVFLGCKNLVINSLSIPNLTNLGLFAFSHGVKISSIANLGSITSLEALIFRECNTLTSVVIPNTVTLIKNHVFCNCSNLTTVNIPTACTQINNNAFDGCSNLDVTLDLSNVTYVGPQAFRECRKLKISNFPKAPTYSTQLFLNAKALTSVTIPKEVVTLDISCFNGCSNVLTLTFEQNSQLKTINASAFAGCGLRTVILPEGCETIGLEAFKETGITLLDIPSTVTRIGYRPFCSISINATVIFRCDLPTFDSDSDLFSFSAQQRNNMTILIYVPDDLVSAYKSAPCFSQYYSDRIFGISQLPQS